MEAVPFREGRRYKEIVAKKRAEVYAGKYRKLFWETQKRCKNNHVGRQEKQTGAAKSTAMSNPSLSLTRRDLARMALAGTASVLLMTTNAPTYADDAPALPAKPAEGTAKPIEGEALSEAVPTAAGYTPSESQKREAMAALKGYPGAFAKARAFPLANDVEPAFMPYPPTAPAKKGASR